MAAGDQYAVDTASMTSLIREWRAGAESVGNIGQQLGAIHGQLGRSIPGGLVEGLIGEVPLLECLGELKAAAQAAAGLSEGLAQDTATLERNLNAYIKAEQEAEARLKAVAAGEKSAATSRIRASGGGSSPGSAGGGNGLQPPGPARYADQARVEEWIAEAFKVLAAAGVPAGALDEAGVRLIIEHESSGNPNAVNDWDANAAAGDPSRGLMQVIGSTFEDYKLPGHDDVYDPVDNIVAGVRYALSRYGSIRNVPGVEGVRSGGSYVGY